MYKASIYFFLIASGCSAEAPPPAPVAVRVTEVRVGALTEGVHSPAVVNSAQTSNLIAQVQGTLLEWRVAEGSAVARGEALARVGSPDLAARLLRVRAEAARAENERDHACGREQVDQRLGRAGDLPADRVEASARTCASARLAATAATQAAREVEAIAEKQSIYAPFDGFLLDQLADPGQVVMPGTPLGVFGSEALVAVGRLSSADTHRGITEGSPALFTDVLGQVARSEVAELGARATGPSRTVEVRAALPPGDWTVGESVSALWVTREVPQAASVPRASVWEDGEKHWIALIHDEHALMQPVTLGARADGWVEISPAPAPGSRVVVGLQSMIPPDAQLWTVEVQP